MVADRQYVWMIETREDLCAHAIWETYCIYKEFAPADAKVVALSREFPELDIRLRSWTLH